MSETRTEIAEQAGQRDLSPLELDMIRGLAEQLAPFANNGQVLREILRTLVAEPDPASELLKQLKSEGRMNAA